MFKGQVVQEYGLLDSWRWDR